MTAFKPRGLIDHRIRRWRAGAWAEVDDRLAGEEPLEIRLTWNDGRDSVTKSIAVTMRTPGSDFELAVGFLYGEGILGGREDVADVSYCTDEAEEQAFNVVRVTLRPGLVFDSSRLERNFYTTSSCGVCGKAALESLEVQGCDSIPSGFEVSAQLVCELPARVREAQVVFEQTGGLHAAGLFDGNGNLVAVYEDVGRHNAVDKLIGDRFLHEAMPLSDYVLMLSGRASFELLQKALVSRIPVVAAVGAPSSLAAELAESFNITLCGFVKPDSLNVYSGAKRLVE